MKELEFNDYNNDPIFNQLAELKPIDEYTSELMRWSSRLETEYERRFEMAGGDEESLIEIGTELAAELRKKSEECPYVHRSVFVTGDVVKGYYDEERHAIEAKEEVYRGERVIMRGFSANISEDELERRRVTVGYELETGEMSTVSNVGSVYFATRYEMLAFAPIGHIEIEGAENSEMRYESLRRDYPEVMRAIDMCLSGNPDLEESLRRLSECRFEADGHMLASDRSAIGEYVYRRLDIEDGMLHSAMIGGAFTVGKRQNGQISVGMIDGVVPVVAVPQGVSLGNEAIMQPSGKAVMSDDWVLHLSMDLFSGDRNEANRSIAIPVSGVKDFCSAREANIVLSSSEDGNSSN